MEGLSAKVENSQNVSITQIIEDKKIPSEIKIVDVEIIDDEEAFPILDIKFRNIGDELAYLKKAVVEILDVVVIQPDGKGFMCQSVTMNYDIELINRVGKLTKSISQSVKPNGSDRITLTLAHKFPDHMLYFLSLYFIYDDDDKYVKYSKNFVIMIKPQYEPYHWGKNRGQVSNLDDLIRFDKYEGIKSGYFNDNFSETYATTLRKEKPPKLSFEPTKRR